MAGLFGGGGTTSSEVTQNLPPELARLYGLQAQQFRQTFPLQQALTEGEAGQIGFTRGPQPTKRVQTGWRPVNLAAQPGQEGFTIDPRVRDAQLRQRIQEMADEGSLGRPWTQAERHAIASEQTALEPQILALQGGAGPGSGRNPLEEAVFQDVPDPEAVPSWTYTGQSPLISALQSSFTLRPEELALPGRIRDINAPLLASLQGGTTDYGDFTKTLSESILRGADRPLDDEAMLFRLNEQFGRNILPEVRSAALRMGHSPDVTSSGYQRLFGDVSRQYGGAVTDVLARSELGRREQTTRAQTLANLVRTGGQENLRASLPLLQALGLSGPQAEAMLAASLREAEGQRAMVPLDLIRRNRIQPPGLPNFPIGQTTAGSNVPTTGAQVGAGLNQALLLALLGQGLGLFGAGAGAGAGAAATSAAMTPLVAGLAMGCWISEVLYGIQAAETKLLRLWFNLKRPTWWVTKLYLKYGQRVAAWLTRHVWAQPLLRRLFDRLLLIAQEELICPTQ